MLVGEGAISLDVSSDSTLIDRKNRGQLAEFERLEAFASCLPHPHDLLFKSLIRGSSSTFLFLLSVNPILMPRAG